VKYESLERKTYKEISHKDNIKIVYEMIFVSLLKPIRILSYRIKFYASSFTNILHSSNKVMPCEINDTARWNYIQGDSEENVMFR
jgi:hypothetical protein